jgi:hypothetical protein
MLCTSTATQLKLSLRNLPTGFRVQCYTDRIEAWLTRVEKFGLRGPGQLLVEQVGQGGHRPTARVVD